MLMNASIVPAWVYISLMTAYIILILGGMCVNFSAALRKQLRNFRERHDVTVNLLDSQLDKKRELLLRLRSISNIIIMLLASMITIEIVVYALRSK